MANTTLQYATFLDGAVQVEMDISTANWRVSQIRCINNSSFEARAFIFKAGELIFTAVAPANQTTSWNTTGVQLAWQPDYFNTITQEWEAGGIDMKDYTLQVQYPAGE